jgi:hypothetical protein
VHIEELHMLVVANCRAVFRPDGSSREHDAMTDMSQWLVVQNFVPLGFRLDNVVVNSKLGHAPDTLAESMAGFCHILNVGGDFLLFEF